MIKRLIALGVAAAVVGGTGFGMWYLLRDNKSIGAPLTATAEIGTIQQSVQGSGTAVPKESASITLNAAGTVQEVYVTVGQQVSVGDPLYTIDSQEARDKLKKAQENLDNLMKDMADLQEDAANLTVRAPFAGKLQEVQKFEPDQEVTKGAAVATLVNDKKLKVHLQGGTPSARVHVLLKSFFDSEMLCNLSMQQNPSYPHIDLNLPSSIIANDRKLSDEYDYIMERKRQNRTLPGTMLPPPSLLLNPIEIDETNTVAKT